MSGAIGANMMNSSDYFRHSTLHGMGGIGALGEESNSRFTCTMS
jgi:hypothetical protein